MKKYLLLLAALAFGQADRTAAAPFGDPSKPTHYIEADAKDRDDRSLIARQGYAIDQVLEGKVYFLGHASDVERLAKLGIKARAHVLTEQSSSSGLRAQASRYVTLPEVEKELKRLADANPSFVTLQSLGKTVEGRDMLMLRISNKTVAEAESEKLPVTFYMGCHHAREFMSVEVPLRFAQHLIAQNGKDPVITRLLASREVYVAPVVNADGFAFDNKNGRSGELWRKNRRNNGDGTFGVDLNRNYGFQWGTGGSSTDTSSEVYMGTQPFSEPESQNVRDFIDSQPRISTLMSIHSFSELVLYPWGHTDAQIGENGAGKIEDRRIFEKMARDMAAFNGYKPMQSSELYIASGDTTDWAYGKHGIFAFTIELSPAAQQESGWLPVPLPTPPREGFYPDPSKVEATFAKNLKPMLYLLEYADNPARSLGTTRLPTFTSTPARQGVTAASFQDIAI